MKILHLACLNNDPEIQPNMDPKCNPVGGEPLIRYLQLEGIHFMIISVTSYNSSAHVLLSLSIVVIWKERERAAVHVRN